MHRINLYVSIDEYKKISFAISMMKWAAENRLFVLVQRSQALGEWESLKE